MIWIHIETNKHFDKLPSMEEIYDNSGKSFISTSTFNKWAVESNKMPQIENVQNKFMTMKTNVCNSITFQDPVSPEDAKS